MSNKSRGGFTLVELLVVVVVIGMLAAMLLPAINGVRESARQAKCINNVKELSTAIFSYTTSTDHYPGHTNPNGSSWVVAILPELGAKDLAEQCRVVGAAPVVKLPAAVCLNDDAFDKDTNPDVISYAINVKICVDRKGNGTTPGEKPVLATDIKNTTNTVLVGELSGITTQPKWHTAGNVFSWYTDGKVKDSLDSEHPTVVMVGFCDGHADKLNKQMDCSAYYGTPDGSVTLTPTPP